MHTAAAACVLADAHQTLLGSRQALAPTACSHVCSPRHAICGVARGARPARALPAHAWVVGVDGAPVHAWQALCVHNVGEPWQVDCMRAAGERHNYTEQKATQQHNGASQVHAYAAQVADHSMSQASPHRVSGKPQAGTHTHYPKAGDSSSYHSCAQMKSACQSLSCLLDRLWMWVCCRL